MTLAFAGDIHFAGRTEVLLNDPAPLVESLRATLGGADVAVVNLETAITTRGTPEPKTYHFRAPDSALQILDDSGVDVVSLANNHAVDYGRDGLTDTLAAQESSPVPVIGIGKDTTQAYFPAVVDVRGTRVGVLAATQIPDRTLAAWSAGEDTAGVASARNPDRLIRAVTDTRADADIVVVFLHWGTDYVACPNAEQRALTDKLVAAGADVIVGSHAHRPQGAGWYGDQHEAYVAYGLGNFVWYRSSRERAMTTGVLTLTLDGRRTTAAEWTPMHIGENGVPVVLTGAQAEDNLDNWAEVRGCADLAAAP